MERGPNKMDSSGWKGGNTTKGAWRRGYRGGRKSIHPAGTVVCSVNFKLTEAHMAMAIYLGEGNATAGVRRALEYFTSRIQSLPLTRDEAYVKATSFRAATRKDVCTALGLPVKAFPSGGSQRLIPSVPSIDEMAAILAPEDPEEDTAWLEADEEEVDTDETP